MTKTRELPEPSPRKRRPAPSTPEAMPSAAMVVEHVRIMEEHKAAMDEDTRKRRRWVWAQAGCFVGFVVAISVALVVTLVVWRAEDRAALERIERAQEEGKACH